MSTNPIGVSPNYYKVLLIDDEAAARKVLRTFIRDYCPQLQIVGEANGVQAGLKLIREQKPGLVFLDVEMGDGQGFDLLDKFERPDFRVIFTTAHDRFAVRAFKYYAVGYLLKPIDPEDLVAAVDHALSEQSSSGLVQLIKAIQQPRKEQVFDRLALPSSEGITMMDVKNIIRLESDAGYTTFFSSTGEKILVTRSIGEFEDALPASVFFRVHVSHLVNLNFVKKYVREDGGYLIMENGQQVPIARRRKDEFLEILRGRSL
ncbi:MAG: LytTR family DNA-binding domain-containing protein [Bacteroidota bacterium]